MILSALLTFSIVSCDLCLVLCSIDDEHLIMNVLVYSDEEKNQKSGLNLIVFIIKKILKMTLIARKTGWGVCPTLCDNAHHSCISFERQTTYIHHFNIFLLFSCICELVQEC